MLAVEYLFSSHIEIANDFAHRQGWRPYGRHDALVVNFLAFLPRLEIVAAGETVLVTHETRFAIMQRLRAVAFVSRWLKASARRPRYGECR
jgi:hypothetical protein